MTPDDIRKGFVAERRNLLITSFALFFYQQAGLQIEKINILGNEAKISDPWWIAFALWILWVYFFFRFYQYFRGIRDKGFWVAYDEQMEQLITRIAFMQFKKQFKTHRAQKGSKYDFQIQQVMFPMKSAEYWSVRSDISIVETPKTTEGERKIASGSKPQLDFTGRELLGIKARAIAHVLVSTEQATEYFVPFLVALLPLVNQLRKFQLSYPFSLYSGG